MLLTYSQERYIYDLYEELRMPPDVDVDMLTTEEADEKIKDLLYLREQNMRRQKSVK